VRFAASPTDVPSRKKPGPRRISVVGASASRFRSRYSPVQPNGTEGIAAFVGAVSKEPARNPASRERGLSLLFRLRDLFRQPSHGIQTPGNMSSLHSGASHQVRALQAELAIQNMALGGVERPESAKRIREVEEKRVGVEPGSARAISSLLTTTLRMRRPRPVSGRGRRISDDGIRREVSGRSQIRSSSATLPCLPGLERVRAVPMAPA